MGLPRQKPHRPRREVKEVRQSEVNEFRHENQKLKRDNLRLRKELEKYRAIWEGDGDDPAETLAAQEPAPALKPGCRECGAPNLARVKIGPKTLVVCKACKFRMTE